MLRALRNRLQNRGRRPAQRAAAPNNNRGRLALPAEARLRPIELGFDDFEAVGQIAGQLSTLARYVVPRRIIEALSQRSPFRLQLYGHYAAEDVTLTNGDYVADLSDADMSITEPGRGGDAAAVRAYVNGSRVPQGDITVDYSANTVTIDGNSVDAGDDVDIYALEGKGQVRLVLATPAGVDQRAVSLYNASLAGLHQTDQADSETAPRLWHGSVREIPLANKSHVEIQVNTPATIPWTADARHVVRFAGHAVQTQAANDPAVQAWLHRVLR